MRRNQLAIAIRRGYFNDNPDQTGSGTSVTNGDTTPSNNGQPNDQSSLSSFTDLWDTDNNKTGNDNQQSQQQPPSQPSVDPSEQFTNYVNSLNFTDGIDASQVIADLNEGNLDSFNNALRTVAANAYKQSLLDSQKIIQAKVDEAVKLAVEKSKGSYQSDMLVQDLQAKFPFTASPEIAPVAKAVLNQLIDNKGMDPKEAIKATGEFFKHLSTKVNETMGTPDSSPGSQGFAPRNKADEPNWDEIFQAMQ